MDQEFWHGKWTRQDIGFHRPSINPHLLRHWPSLGLGAGTRVLVPLAGKSLDVKWLRDQGHEVVAIELSEIAVEGFFTEARLAPRRTPEGVFMRYEADGIRFLAGDLFATTPAQIGPIDAVYDRASLIALPRPMRSAYATHIASLQRQGVLALLIALEYAEHEMKGPPFPVLEPEIRALFAATHAIDAIAAVDVTADEPGLRARGATRLVERVYRLERRG